MAAVPFFSNGMFPPAIFRSELIPLDYDAIRLGRLGGAPYQRAWPPRTIPRMPKKNGTGRTGFFSEVGSSGALGNVSSNGAGKSNGTAPTEEYKPKVYGNSPFLTFKNIANPGKLPMGAPRPYKPGKEIFKK
eukprot:EC118905.1.p1 GENE.EC118905.1~~EC118905.1.p1  ORF type:complete len:132 (+),score=36.39 EC118905.1:76-471(+)